MQCDPTRSANASDPEKSFGRKIDSNAVEIYVKLGKSCDSNQPVRTLRSPLTFDADVETSIRVFYAIVVSSYAEEVSLRDDWKQA